MDHCLRHCLISHTVNTTCTLYTAIYMSEQLMPTQERIEGKRDELRKEMETHNAE